MPTLILTPRYTADSQSLWRAANNAGWRVHRLVQWRVPPDLRSCHEPVLYVEALFAPMIAAEFGQVAKEPPENWLCTLPPAYRKRDVQLMSLATARQLSQPHFIKPPNDKTFRAEVMVGSSLPPEFDGNMPVLVSEVVTWRTEFRCFILDRKVVATSIYARDGVLQRDNDFAASSEELVAAAAFAAAVAADPLVPLDETAVLDVGMIEDKGWAVVEQNAAWGAGLYACDPSAVLDVLRKACKPARLG